jgi:uncharacterized protein
MNEHLRDLYELHLVDDRIHHAQQGLAALDVPHPLVQQHQRIVAELGKQEAALAKSKAELQDFELRLRSMESKREADRTKLYGGKIVGTRELQALEQEIHSLDGLIDAGEGKVLEAMEKVEPIQAAVDKLRSYKKSAEEKLAALNSSHEIDRKRFLADLNQSQSLRAQAVENVDPALLKQYDQIRRIKGHPGIAVVQGGACGCCHTSIPTMVMRKLLEGQSIIQCDNCLRIYYLPGTGAEAR